MFTTDFISGLHDFKRHLTSWVLILIHSPGVCILVMACVDCTHMCSKKPFPASLTMIMMIKRLSQSVMLYHQ